MNSLDSCETMDGRSMARAVARRREAVVTLRLKWLRRLGHIPSKLTHAKASMGHRGPTRGLKSVGETWYLVDDVDRAAAARAQHGDNPRIKRCNERSRARLSMDRRSSERKQSDSGSPGWSRRR